MRLRNHCLHIKQLVGDLRDERRGEATEIEGATRTDAALALAECAPERTNAEAKGRNGSSTGDNNSASLPCHGRISLRRQPSRCTGLPSAAAATATDQSGCAEQGHGSWCWNHGDEERLPAEETRLDGGGP